MAAKHSDDFKREAVRIVTHSGLRPWRRFFDLGQVGAGLLNRSGCRRGRGAAPGERALAQKEPRSAGGEGIVKKGRDLLREPWRA